ncbi:hypothetical protein CYLTODRAFT_413714 [Cylindrobasidium torrendii FP15055 ss-10]|uniref:Family A G protein-coupled receptor-like protein n=1 Tax=Cylindrobasidium torrendii FP15055 ss-10 TaxID=1314674 RepID=A0A0D7B107_9AGAR|nr:hypothetical protein CYLTODRAFT_413714 [Cylindrobasidium torrendii FP15055 ss-10]
MSNGQLEDETLLREIGLETAFNVSIALVQTLLWSFNAILFLVALLLQLRVGVRTMPKAFVLIATHILFLISTAIAALTISIPFVQIETILSNNSGGSLDIRNKEFFRFLAMPSVEAIGISVHLVWIPWLSQTQWVIGDAIVIWRAWALCQGSRMRRILALPVLFVTAATVFSTYNMARLIMLTSHKEEAMRPWDVDKSTSTVNSNIAAALSLSANIVATGSVAWMTLVNEADPKDTSSQHHRLTKMTMRQPRSKTGQVLTILVESGIFYIVVLGLRLVENIYTRRERLQPKELYAAFVYENCVDQFASMYPTVIIVLVHLRCSNRMQEEFSVHINNESPADEISAPRFRRGPNTSTESASSQGSDIVTV